MKLFETLRALPKNRPWAFWLLTVVLALLVFEPLTDLWKVALREGLVNGTTALVDGFYSKAADDPLGSSVASLMWGGLVALFVLGQRQWGIASKIRKRGAEILLQLKNEPNPPAFRKGDELSDLESIERLVRSNARTTLGMQVILAVCMVWISVQFLYLAVGLLLEGVHRSRMTVLEPLLLPREVSQVWAEWYQMDSRDDYEQLRKRMNALAAARSVTLPGTKSTHQTPSLP